MTRTAIVLLALLTACASPRPAPQPPSGPPARVDLTRVIASAPFAGLLAQYDADIAALKRSANDPALAGMHDAIGTSAADVARRLDAGSRRLRDLHVRPVALPNPGAQPARDFGAAVAPFRAAASGRAERAIALRAAQMREREATIAYDFERAHGGRRLVLELKLRDLHLDAETRRRDRAALAGLDAREAALVAAARAGDDAELASYRAQQMAQASAAAQGMAADVATHARTASAVRLQAVPSAWVPRWSDGDAAATAARFGQARGDLTNGLHALAKSDDAGRRSVNDEISALQRERDALRAEILASAQDRAARIAASHGLGRVYTTAAPSNARDLTGAVLQSYSVSTGS